MRVRSVTLLVNCFEKGGNGMIGCQVYHSYIVLFEKSLVSMLCCYAMLCYAMLDQPRSWRC